MIQRLDKVVSKVDNRFVKLDKIYTVLGVKDVARKKHYYIATEIKIRKYLPARWFISKIEMDCREDEGLTERLEERGF